MTLPELTAPVSLTRPDGRLNRLAVGWARQPLVNTDGVGRGFCGRNKRWEYWFVTTPTHLLSLTVSSVDYAALHEVWIFDRRTQRTWGRTATLLPARGVVLAPSFGAGPSSARAKGLEIDLTEVDGGTRLQARTTDASFDVIAELPDDHERLSVVVPWSDTRFQYTVKDVARPAHGTLTVDGRTVDIPEGESWAVLDHGRGRWPYDTRWNWGAGSGISNGRVIGVQVGGTWTDGTGSTENAIVLDGRVHYLGDPVQWDFDRTDWHRPWQVTGSGLALTFEPFYDKVSGTNFGIVSTSTNQYFGDWSGTFTVGGGDPVSFSGILGCAEDVHNRW